MKRRHEVGPGEGAWDGAEDGRAAGPAACDPREPDAFDEMGELLEEYFDGSGRRFDGIVMY